MENLMIKASALEIFERFNDSPKEQLELAQLLFRCGIRGDEIKSDNLAVDIAAKAILKDSFLSRENYKQRCERTAKYGVLGKEYGAQGKEYGIQGKDYGKLGGRPRKGETKEQYAERKKEENAEWEKQQEICGMITAEQGLVDFIKCASQKQYQELIDEYVSKGYTKSQVNKAFEYIRSKNG